MILLCATAFQNITSLKRKRLNTISVDFLRTGESPKERRGGHRCSKIHEEICKSIILHIKQFPVHQSHYGRKGSRRQYLSSNLSIVKMFKLWQAMRKELNLPTATYWTYRKIFRERFNLSFKAPSTDICVLVKNTIIKFERKSTGMKICCSGSCIKLERRNFIRY